MKHIPSEGCFNCKSILACITNSVHMQIVGVDEEVRVWIFGWGRERPDRYVQSLHFGKHATKVGFAPDDCPMVERTFYLNSTIQLRIRNDLWNVSKVHIEGR